MFGNLFSQRKYKTQEGQDVSGQIPVQPVSQQGFQQPVSQQQPNMPVQPVVPTQLPVSVQPVSPSPGLTPTDRQDLSVLSHLDARSQQVLSNAEKEAKRLNQQFIDIDQILLALLADSEVVKTLEAIPMDVAKLTRDTQAKEQMGTFQGQPSLSDAGKQLFEKAYSNAKKRSVDFLSPEDLLIALFDTAEAATLEAEGLKKDALSEKLSKNSEYISGKRSVLDKFGIDITQQAKEGQLDPIAGRDREIERLVHIILRRTKNNPVIIGEAGVGKTAIVEGLAQKIAAGQAPKDLLDKRIIQLDLTSIVAGASHRGEFEERLRSVIKEAQLSEGKVVLFIDEIHTLVGTGDTQGAMDASNIVKPFLARGQLQIIGTTTTAEYRKYFEKDKAFERRFQPVLVDEPSEEGAMEMLNIIKPKYEKFHNVTFDAKAIESAVKLSKRYIGQRYLPDKGVDLMDEAAAQVRLEQTEGKRQDNMVKSSDIERVVSNWTGIPITKLTEDEGAKLLQLEQLIHKRMINQENAVLAVSEAVRRGRIGLAAANRPIASFIFLGPTGVGKTELAKTLAEILFGKEDATIRLDMSEYMEKHEVAKLIGAPPGYVGYEEGGQLTEAVRAKPYSIVLLDEIEKAHPDVFNILLQLLEDGRLTDNKGNTISFKNTIIIATSNIGSSLIQQELLKKHESEEKKAQPEPVTQQKNGQKEEKPQSEEFKELTKILVSELRKFFKPELINRFDEVVVFEPLTRDHMADIAKLRLAATKKMLSEQNIDIEVTEKALSQLAKEGYDPIYGARPLRRLVQTAIENPVAVLIIGKNFVSGDKILVDFDTQKNEYTFQKAQPAPGQVQVPNGQTQPPQPQTAQQPQQVSPQEQQGGVLTPAQPGAASQAQPVNGNPQALGSDGTQMSPSR